MTSVDAAYLTYLIVAFAAFAGVLAWATHQAPGTR